MIQFVSLPSPRSYELSLDYDLLLTEQMCKSDKAYHFNLWGIRFETSSGYRMLSSGLFPNACSLNANVSEQSVLSSQAIRHEIKNSSGYLLRWSFRDIR
jgi:hypothetical protein